jgi:hypothetical protein
MPVTSFAYLADKGDLIDLLLLVGGVVLLPAWLVATGAPNIPARRIHP